MPVKIAPVALTIIGTLCVAGIILLTALGHTPPAILDYLATGSLSALAGALLPGIRDNSSSSGPAPSSPAPAVPVAVAAAAPAAAVQLVASQQPASPAVNPLAAVNPAAA